MRVARWGPNRSRATAHIGEITNLQRAARNSNFGQRDVSGFSPQRLEWRLHRRHVDRS